MANGLNEDTASTCSPQLGQKGVCMLHNTKYLKWRLMFLHDNSTIHPHSEAHFLSLDKDKEVSVHLRFSWHSLSDFSKNWNFRICKKHNFSTKSRTVILSVKVNVSQSSSLWDSVEFQNNVSISESLNIATFSMKIIRASILVKLLLS